MNANDPKHKHYEEMVLKLKSYGVNHSFAPLGTAVVIVGPGEPFNVYPTYFAATDLEKASRAGFLQPRRLSGWMELGIYAVI